MSPFEFARTDANSTGVWGAECKFALHAFEKAQMIKSSSPCNSLEETTQNPYMAWAILNLNKLDKNSRNNRG